MGVLGNTFDETLGLTTAGVELMPKQAGKVSRGLRTIGNNMANLANESGKLEYKIGGTTKSLSLIDEQTGDMKSTFDIFKDLDKDWDKMSKSEKQALGISLAGKNQFEVFSAVLSNFDTALKATETSMNSQGSAAKENEKALDSIQGKLAKLKSAFEELANTLISSDFVKGLLDMTTGLLKFLNAGDALIPKLGLIALGIKGIGKAVDVGTDFFGSFTKSAEKGGKASKGIGNTLKKVGGIVIKNPWTAIAGSLFIAGVYALHYFSNTEKVKRAQEDLAEAVQNVSNKQKELSDLQEKSNKTDADYARIGPLKKELELLKEIAKEKAQVAIEKLSEEGREAPPVVSPLSKAYSGEKQASSQNALEYEKYQQAIRDSDSKTAYEYLQKLQKRKEGFDKAIKQGGELGEEDKKVYDELAGYLAKIKAGNIIEDTNKSTKELNASTKQYNKYLEDSDKAFKMIKQNEGLTKLGEIDGDKFKLAPGSVKDFAKELGYTEKAAQELLDSMEEAGKVEWDFDTKKITKEIEATGDVAKDSEGNLMMSRKAIQAYGKANGYSAKQIGALVDALEESGNTIVDFDAPTKELKKQILGLGDSFGLVVDESGKLSSVNLDTFVGQMYAMGASDADVNRVIQSLGGLEGVDTSGAVYQINAVTGEIEKIPPAKKTDIKADTSNALPPLGQVKSSIDSLHDKKVEITTIRTTINNVVNKVKEVFSGKAKGTKHASKGMAFVNDQKNPPNGDPAELIVSDKNGVYIANNGELALVNLEEGDRVYTASETQDILAGEGDESVFPRYAKGKKSSRSSIKSLYGKRKGSSKEGKGYEKKLSALEQSFDIGRISESSYIKSLKRLSTKTKMTLDQWRSYQKTYYDYVNEQATNSLDSRIEALNTESGYTKSNIDKMSKAMKSYYKSGKISIDQYNDYQKQVTKAGLEYSLNAYEKQGGSFTDLKDKLKKALNSSKITLGEYYQYLDDLIEKATDKEQERFEKYQEQQDAKREMLELYADEQKEAIQDQIDNLEKQKDAQDEANEAADRANQLAEKEQALATAKSQRIKIYREGVGYVWESNIEEVSKAQKELDELKKQFADEDTTKAIDKQIEELEKQQQAWEDYIDAENKAAEIKQLEKEAGISFGSITSGLGILLTEAFKSKYNTAGELAKAYEDIANAISEGKIKVNSSTGKIDQATLNAYINKNKYADGTLSANGGLSLVGEKGAEWRVLNKGDGIIPNSLTKNLTELGKFNPSQWQAIMAKDMSSKSDSIAQYYYNFDKLVLPNVQDANALLRELQQLSNKAIQSSKKRI